MKRMTVSGYKLKSTRVMLVAYKALLEKYRPNCTSIARMKLWEDDTLKEGYEHKQFSIMMHNMQSRIQSAYHNENPKCPIHLLYEKVGMLNIDDYLALIDRAANLNSALCNDMSINV